MIRKSFGPQQERSLLEVSFEPQDDGYLYYRNRWARGIPVTASERETYLSAGSFGARAPFHEAIRGRTATARPRKYGPVYWKLLSRMPLTTAGGALIFGLVVAAIGLGVGPLAGRALLVIAGAAFIAFGAQIIFARVRPKR
jgi:hypothetical protein